MARGKSWGAGRGGAAARRWYDSSEVVHVKIRVTIASP